MANDIDLKGRTAVVTGGAQGFGKAITERFLKSGARVAIWDQDIALARKTAQALGGDVEAVACDVSDPAAVTKARDATTKALGRIDILVNNAAIFSTIKMRPFWEIPLAEWDELMGINVRGVWLAAKAVVPQMRKQGSGRIVNISSGVVFMGRPNYLHYVASKGAVVAMTRAMAKELGEFGINVNAITPGPVYTEVPRETVTPEQREAMIRAQSIKRAAAPQDLEGTVVFLCSEDAAFITGQTINVDGGLNFH